MKALEIYTASREERPARWQEYYLRLREALHAELLNEGGSDLIDVLLRQETGSRIQYLAAAAVYDCYYMLILGRAQTDVSRYFPSWQGEPQRWDVLDARTGEYCVSMQSALKERLEALQSVSRQMLELRMGGVAPSPETAAAHEMEHLRKQSDWLRRELTAAQERSQELSRELEELKHGYISESLRLHLADRKRQADAAFEAETAQRRQEAEEAFARHYTGALEEHRRQREVADRQAAQAADARRNGYRAVRESIGESLRGMQRELAQQMTQWESQLRSVDYRFLAECYVSLSRAVQLDMAQTLASAAAQGTPDEAMAALGQLRGDLLGQLLRMEHMMQQLGLTVLRPEKGEAFDERLHRLSGTVTQLSLPVHAVIAEMVLPGVVQAEDVLVRAEVQI